MHSTATFSSRTCTAEGKPASLQVASKQAAGCSSAHLSCSLMSSMSWFVASSMGMARLTTSLPTYKSILPGAPPTYLQGKHTSERPPKLRRCYLQANYLLQRLADMCRIPADQMHR